MPRDPAKERIITSAREIMLQMGVSNLSVDVVVGQIGMSKRTFYKIFRSKEDLLSELVERMLAELRARIMRITRSERDFLDKMEELLSFFAAQAGRFSPASLRDLRKISPAVWHRIEEFRRQRIRQVFTHLIAQGITQGYLRNDLNVRIFQMAYLGAVDAILVPNVLANESFSAQEAVREIVWIFFRGILTPEGREKFEHLHTGVTV